MSATDTLLQSCVEHPNSHDDKCEMQSVSREFSMSKRERVHVELFYSQNCPYCPMAKKMLYEIAGKYSDVLNIEEIDAWSNSGEERSNKYGIKLVPSIVVNGEKKMEGIPNRALMTKIIEQAVGEKTAHQ